MRRSFCIILQDRFRAPRNPSFPYRRLLHPLRLPTIRPEEVFHHLRFPTLRWRGDFLASHPEYLFCHRLTYPWYPYVDFSIRLLMNNRVEKITGTCNIADVDNPNLPKFFVYKAGEGKCQGIGLVIEEFFLGERDG